MTPSVAAPGVNHPSGATAVEPLCTVFYFVLNLLQPARKHSHGRVWDAEPRVYAVMETLCEANGSRPVMVEVRPPAGLEGNEMK